MLQFFIPNHKYKVKPLEEILRISHTTEALTRNTTCYHKSSSICFTPYTMTQFCDKTFVANRHSKAYTTHALCAEDGKQYYVAPWMCNAVVVARDFKKDAKEETDVRVTHSKLIDELIVTGEYVLVSESRNTPKKIPKTQEHWRIYEYNSPSNEKYVVVTLEINGHTFSEVQPIPTEEDMKFFNIYTQIAQHKALVQYYQYICKDLSHSIEVLTREGIYDVI